MKRFGIVAGLLGVFLLLGQAECPTPNDLDGDGYTVEQGDCDDADATVYPGADEPCDGVDHDCDGIACITQGDTEAP